MSPKATRNENIDDGATSADNGNLEPEAEVRRRAYEIYLERGEQPGFEVDDWLQAERELQAENLRRA
jgi:hypothetical protein